MIACRLPTATWCVGAGGVGGCWAVWGRCMRVWQQQMGLAALLPPLCQG